MPIPLAAPLIVGAATSAFQLGSGILQGQQAKNELEDLGERPEYEIPAGAQASLSIARRQAQEGIPLASRNLFDANINQMQANTAANMGDLRAGLSGVQGAAGSAAQAYRQQAVQDAQMRTQNLMNLQRAQDMMAGYQETAQYENVLNPYDIRRAEILGSLERGQAEKAAGLQSILNLGGAALTSGMLGGESGAASKAPTAAKPPINNGKQAPYTTTGGSGMGATGMYNPSYNLDQELQYFYG